MFRIDRSMVKLAGVRTLRLGNELGETDSDAPDDFDEEIIHYGVNPHEMIQEATHKAERILDAARNEAADLMLSARDEAEENSRRAWDEGYIEGVREGKLSYDEKIKECEISLKNVIEELYNERVLTYSKLEDELIDLALGIVKKIINPAEEALKNVFESLIINALRQIALDDKIVLRVSPPDYERFFSQGNAVFELSNGVSVSASVLKDFSLGEFDCVIDKDDSTINAGLDTQLKHIQLSFTNNKA